MAVITISLPNTLIDFVAAQMAGKGYRDVSAYFRGLLQEAWDKEQECHLEPLLLDGLASRTIPLDARFQLGLETKVETLFQNARGNTPR